MKAILACDPRGGIGFKGQLPWGKLDGDLARFKQLTGGNAILMGRSTWESLPKKPLPNRKNIVISSSTLDLPNDVIQIDDIKFVDSIDNLWCIGGARLLSTVWDRIEEFHLTRVRETYICDTFVDLLYLEHNFQKSQSVQFLDNDYEIWIRQ